MKRTIFQPPRTKFGTASQVNLFATPVMVFEWPEATYWHDELLDAIEKRRRRSKGVETSNIDGAWQSKSDLPSWQEQSVTAFVRWAAAMASRATSSWRQDAAAVSPGAWRMNGWANIQPSGGARHNSHRHVEQAWNWSATYFVSAPVLPPEAKPRGDLVFEDRLIGIDTIEGARANRRTFSHEPSAGELVIYPSSLFHRTEPHNGDKDRVSIGLNFHSEWLEASTAWSAQPTSMWRKSGEAHPAPPGYDIRPEPTYL